MVAPQSGPPLGSAGGLVPWTIVLPRTQDIYAVLQDFEAFPSGVLFTLRARFRPGTFDPRPRPGQPSQLPGTPGGPHVAVTYPDGREGKSVPPTGPDVLEPGNVILRYFRGSGGGDEWWMRLWMSPLPPRGPLTWHLGWPEKGAPTTSVEVEGAELIEAARQAQDLW